MEVKLEDQVKKEEKKSMPDQLKREPIRIEFPDVNKENDEYLRVKEGAR